MFKHLKDRAYYEDRYDRSTVEGARWYEENVDRRKESKKEREIVLRATNLLLYFYTGNRWKNRGETINQWMDRDRAYDEMMENTPIPKGIVCFMCEHPMEFSNKYGHYGFDKEPHQIDFYFRCADCHVGMKIKDGIKERIIPWMCPQCKRKMKSETKESKNEIRTRDWCEYCGYEKKDVFDLTPSEPEKAKEVDPEEERRFREDRLRFCLTDKEGVEYLDGLRRMEELKKVMEGIKAREEERKSRLKDNPKGFPLNDGHYSCGMCKHDVPSYENWYDKYGIKCMACQHALERKTVPLKYFKNTDTWYPMWALKSEFGIHPQTAMKYVRQGKLKVYIIPGENGSPTCYVFPKAENQKILQDYRK
jgi:hypothetical protein